MSDIDALRIAQGLRLPPLRLQAIRSPDGTGRSRDLLVRVDWRGQQHVFSAEVKGSLTPRKLRHAIHDAGWSGARGPEALRMIIAPYLSAESLAILAESEISGIDLSGNGVVVVPGEWFILRSGEKNQYPASAGIKSIYRGTSSLVARVFLSRPEFARFTDIAEEIRRRGGSISAPTVSKVLPRLEEDLVVERAGQRFRVLDPGRLLGRLVEHDQPRAAARARGTFSDPADTPATLRARADASRTKLVLRDEHLYVTVPGGDEVMTYYTQSIARVIHGSSFVEEPRFGDVELIETPRQEVFFDAREHRGRLCCAPLQVYLELAGGGKRERELAESMRADLLAFRYE
jgi:DNA-binding transcriptional ArsR family regulator